MTKLLQAEELINTMTRAERAPLLQWVVRDLGESFPGVECDRRSTNRFVRTRKLGRPGPTACRHMARRVHYAQ